MDNIYERKISSEEATNGYFLVLKNKPGIRSLLSNRIIANVGDRKSRTHIILSDGQDWLRATGLSCEKRQRGKISIPSELKNETSPEELHLLFIDCNASTNKTGAFYISSLGGLKRLNK
jgi:hypothetical protein